MTHYYFENNGVVPWYYLIYGEFCCTNDAESNARFVSGLIDIITLFCKYTNLENQEKLN